MRLRKIALAMLCLHTLQATPAHARIYKWTDQQGVVHYADHAPSSAQAQTLSSRSLPGINVVTATAPESSPSKHLSKIHKHASSKRRTSASNSETQRQKRKRRCARYAHEIEVIQARLRAGYREPQGNRWHAKERALASKRFRECQGI